MTTYWEIAAHSLTTIFFLLHWYLIVDFDFSNSVFKLGLSFCLRNVLLIAYYYIFIRQAEGNTSRNEGSNDYMLNLDSPA